MTDMPPLPAEADPQAAPAVPLAGFWIRAGAYTIDGFLLFFVQIFLGVVGHFSGIPSPLLQRDPAAAADDEMSAVDVFRIDAG